VRLQSASFNSIVRSLPASRDEEEVDEQSDEVGAGILVSYVVSNRAMHPKDRPPINRRSIERVLKASFLPRLYALADKSDIERTDVTKAAIASYERSRVKLFSGAYPKPANQLELELIKIVDEAVSNDTTNPTTIGRKPVKQSRLKDPHQAIYYSRVLIETFQEVLDYDSARHHNRPAPTLRLENPEYLAFVRELVAELKQLNSLLIKSNRSSLATSATLVALSKHFNKFLSSYAGAMGKVAAGLTGGAIVGLLYHTGAGKDVIDAIWGHLKLPK
jgi:hypothetical protein